MNEKNENEIADNKNDSRSRRKNRRQITKKFTGKMYTRMVMFAELLLNA